MKKSETVSVKKTLTIPKWMNEQATAAGINFSQTLQDAIRKELENHAK
jgi:antitoxin HicB